MMPCVVGDLKNQSMYICYMIPAVKSMWIALTMKDFLTFS